MQANKTITHTLAIVISSSFILAQAQAAIIVEASSELDYRHSYLINNGSVPDGISLSNVPQSLTIQGNVQSSANEATAINEEAGSVQIGNPFATPPLPFESRRQNRTTFNSGAEGAQSDYDVSITARDDPNADPSLTSIVERTIDNSGGAEVVLSTQDVSAQASSFYNAERGYRLVNISNNRQVFSIIGDVSFDMFSQFEGSNGFASASVSLFTLFENVQGVAANFSLGNAYNPDIVEDGAGASVFESLTFNEPNIGGFLFNGSTMAQGNGGITTASISEQFTYRLELIMDAGASFDFFTGFRQRNITEYDPQSINVSAPIGLGLFSLALLAFIRRP